MKFIYLILLPLSLGFPIHHFQLRVSSATTDAIELLEGVRDSITGLGRSCGSSRRVLTVDDFSGVDSKGHQHPQPDRGQQVLVPQPPRDESGSESEPESSASTWRQHGSFVNLDRVLKSKHRHHLQTASEDENEAESLQDQAQEYRASIKQVYIRTLRKPRVPTYILDKYTHELIALGLLALVPITLGIIELAERIARNWVVEEYPERGRERRQSIGMEREFKMEARIEREKKVKEESYSWRKCQRN